MIRQVSLAALLVVTACDAPQPTAETANGPSAPPPQSAPPFAAPDEPATPEATPPAAGAPTVDPIEPRERVGT